jgi:MATE family, multidrug efflux pump
VKSAVLVVGEGCRACRGRAASKKSRTRASESGFPTDLRRGSGDGGNRAAVAVLTAIVVVRARTFRELGLTRTPLAPHRSSLRELARSGLWIGVRILLGEGFLPVLAFFVAGYGAAATTAHAVGLRLESLIAVFALGFSGAASAVAAWARQDHDWRALRDLRSALLIIGGAYSATLSLVVLASGDFLTRVVFEVEDPTALDMFHALVPLVVAYFVADTSVTVSMGYLVGLSDTRLPTLVVAAGYWIVGLGIGIPLAEFTDLGFYGLWLGMIVGACATAAFTFARSGHHIRSLKAEPQQANHG